jgi:integrase
MASIRKRNGKWQVQIRKQGQRSISKSFLIRENALAWARSQEIAFDRGEIRGDHRNLGDKTLADLLQKYLDEVTPRKRQAPNESICLKAFMQFDIAKKRLVDITSSDFAILRDQRLKEVKASSFNRQIGRVQSAYEVAIREWDWPLKENPVKRIRKPPNEAARQRRLKPGELEKLLEGLKTTQNRLLKPIILFAIETGMRQGEILKAEWKHYNKESRVLLIPVTKNGQSRTIPLSKAAILILDDLEQELAESRIFPTTSEAIKQSWQRLVERAEIHDLHFHDLRHEAVSRFFEKGLSVPEVALISGHKDYRMLARYTHLKAEDIVHRL